MGPRRASPGEVMLPLALGFPLYGGNRRMKSRVSPCAHHPCTRPPFHIRAARSSPGEAEGEFVQPERGERLRGGHQKPRQFSQGRRVCCIFPFQSLALPSPQQIQPSQPGSGTAAVTPPPPPPRTQGGRSIRRVPSRSGHLRRWLRWERVPPRPPSPAAATCPPLEML